MLLLTENAPMVTFAKFNVLSGDTPLRAPSPVYQVNTGEILGAFALLKDAGYPRRNLVAAQDPQLEIEAMIDPLAPRGGGALLPSGQGRRMGVLARRTPEGRP